MASTTITANVVVQFGKQVGASAEVDDRAAGYNNGKTSFVPGEVVYLLLFYPEGYEVKFSESSAGNLVKVADDQKDITDEVVQFADTDSASTQYPMSSIPLYSNIPATWLGTSLGSLRKVGESEVTPPARARDASTGKPNPEHRIGIAKVSYSANCEVWKLYGVPTLSGGRIIDQVMCFWVVGEI